jgi:fused signal recognition particle receptor
MSDIIARWRSGLSKTSKTAFGRIASLVGATEISQDTWEELEMNLIQADLGIEAAGEIISAIQELVRDQGLLRTGQLQEALNLELMKRLSPPPKIVWSVRPSVLLVVGINGSGKTTTIAKLTRQFLGEGKTVLIGAADTFRAAAVDQLQEWGSRLGVDVIAGAPESDPGAVAFNAVQAGIARKVDMIIIDTAGRLHTKLNLMEELKKIRRVIAKALEGAPQAVWLVLDATVGQNALQQARAFKEAVGVTGIILAKLDSSAKGGMVFAIQRELDLPILYAGLGEKPEDLQVFSPEAFVMGLLSFE